MIKVRAWNWYSNWAKEWHWSKKKKKIPPKTTKGKIRVGCWGISFSNPDWDRWCCTLANTLQLTPPCLKNSSCFKACEGWTGQNVVYSFIWNQVFCSFLFPHCLMLQMPRHRPKNQKPKRTPRDRIRDFSSTSPLLHVTSLSLGNLSALRCIAAAPQLLTLWLHMVKREHKVVENRREPTKMNTSTFAEDSAANDDYENANPLWTQTLPSVCSNTMNHN